MLISYVLVYLVKVTLLFDTMITMFQKDGKYVANFYYSHYMLSLHVHVYLVKVLLFDTMIKMFQNDGKFRLDYIPI